MGWLKNLFSAGATELVGEVGNVIDNLVTSDEERIKLKNTLEIAIMAHSEKQAEQALSMEQEISARHKADMASDSWLSKNVRPLTLIFLTLTTVGLAYLTIFLLPVEKVDLLTPWITLLTALLVTVYTFYFGSRGIEKVQKIKRGADQ
jgi:hypothetical protein